MADYRFLKDQYPAVVTKEQFHRICHISKRTAKYYLDNGFIQSKASAKKTRRYKIKLTNIIAFLEDRDANPEKYYLPTHSNNPFMPAEKRQRLKLPRNGKYADCFKLKSAHEVPDYRKYLNSQFKDYPDMMKTQYVRQLTGHSISVIKSWCKDQKVRFIYTHASYYIQKQSLIDYLYEREMQG